MRHGSLFSGIGGFDLAAEWMGWDNVFHCEWMPFPRQVLHHHFPNSISYEDITKTDFTIHRGTIDILTGGFPCQPYSSAGKRLGKEDERHLWPHMLRAIQEIEPTYVVGENVRGLTNWNGGVVFEEVCADLEDCGYEVQPVLLSACSVGAPHRRDRIWFIAANSKSKRSRQQQSENNRWEDRRFNNNGTIWDAANTKCVGRKQCGFQINSTNGGVNAFNDINTNDESKFITNSEFIRLEHGTKDKQIFGTETIAEGKWNKSSLSIKANGGRYKSNWDNFPTQSPICSGDDGLPTELDGITFSKWRQESIKGYGNAVVPQVAYEIFKVIQQLDGNQVSL